VDMVWHHGEGMQLEEIQLTLAAQKCFHDATSDARVRQPHWSKPCLAKLLVQKGVSFSGAHPLLQRNIPDMRRQRAM